MTSKEFGIETVFTIIGTIFGIIGIFTPILGAGLTIALFVEVFERSVSGSFLQAYLFAGFAFAALCVTTLVTFIVGRAAFKAWGRVTNI